MAELADAPDSKSGYGDIVWVRFPLSAVKTPWFQGAFLLLKYVKINGMKLYDYNFIPFFNFFWCT